MWPSLREEMRVGVLGGESRELFLSDLGLDGVPWQHQLLDRGICGTLWGKAVFLKGKGSVTAGKKNGDETHKRTQGWDRLGVSGQGEKVGLLTVLDKCRSSVGNNRPSLARGDRSCP